MAIPQQAASGPSGTARGGNARRAISGTLGQGIVFFLEHGAPGFHFGCGGRIVLQERAGLLDVAFIDAEELAEMFARVFDQSADFRRITRPTRADLHHPFAFGPDPDFCGADGDLPGSTAAWQRRDIGRAGVNRPAH
jgi:hypothetical protein